ncbi:hypothetical protein LTR37_001654 [Vermiconidia calcicola]|uniref:Uncharacterized protein n=1 Tax=Vermiconidia calcicola TaxID=1690605 RepID=A0ACC3NVT5_9PEZI|nr:hypothetical protein LTR37_001654 [Vermiconidia calcicola]
MATPDGPLGTPASVDDPAASTAVDTEQSDPAGASLEPDSTSSGDNADSALGSETHSTRSESLATSINGYKYENGRRYHAYREGAYYLPNDEAEQARLDLVHHIWRLASDGALFAAPLPTDGIQRVLDFGTGTGIWTARPFDADSVVENAEVIGTDLSPIQPTWVPPNLRFYVDDVEAEWDYRPDEAFDLVHGRGMVGAIKDWPLLFRRIRSNLKPGGWCEMQEYQGWVFSRKDISNTSLDKWQKLVNEASSKFGNVLDMAPRIRQLMIDSQFTEVKESIINIPIGAWAKGRKEKELGLYQQEHICDCVDSYTLGLFTRVLGWSPEECQILMASVKNEVRDPQHQLIAALAARTNESEMAILIRAFVDNIRVLSPDSLTGSTVFPESQ